MPKKSLAASLFFIAAAASLGATSWTHTTVADFQAGSDDGNINFVSSGDGAVRLAKLAGTLGAFQSVTPMPGTLTTFSPWTYGNRVFVAGGYLNGSITAAIYSNDIDASGNLSSTWVSRGSLPATMVAAGVARWMNHLYLGGGDYNGSGGVTTNLLMTTLDASGIPSTWQSVGPLPGLEGDGHFVAAQGRLLYFAGNGSSYAMNTVYAAPIQGDGTLGAWTSLSNRPFAVRLFSTNYIGDSVILAGGEDSSYAGSSNVIGASIGTQGTLSPWSTDNALPQPRSYFTGGEGDGAGKIFILGGKTSSVGVTWGTVYSAPVSASGTVGAWATEASLPLPRMTSSWLSIGGKIHYFGGCDFVNQKSTVYSASLNQGATNAASGSFAGHFDLGSDQAISTLTWTSNAAAYVQLQARVAPSSGVFGAWTSLTTVASIDLSAQSPARYVEYRAKLTDNAAGSDIELEDVTLNGPVPTATATVTPSVTPASLVACPVSAGVSLPYSGVGTPGDILMTTFTGSYLVGFDPTTETYYLHTNGGSPMTGDVSSDAADPTKQLVIQGGNNIYRYDANGVFLSVWATTSATNLQLGEFAPDGAYWVADQVGNGIYRIPSGGGTGIVKGLSIAPSAPTACVFDNLGNLYISDSFGGGGRILKVASANQGSVTMTATVLLSGILNIYGMAYDGDHTLYFGSSSAGASSFYKADTVSGVSTLLDSNFAPLAQNGGGALYHGSDLVFGLDGSLYLSQSQNPGVTGLLKMGLNGTPQKFYPLPASIGGISTAGWFSDGLGVLGSAGARSCLPSPTASPSSTPSLTRSATPSASPTATTTATRTASPSSSATPSVSPSATATLTPSQTPDLGLTTLVSSTATLTPTVTGTATTTPGPQTPLPTTTPTPKETPPIIVTRPRPGTNDPVQCTVRAEKGGLCSVRIYRPEGRICRRVWQGPLVPMEKRVVVWQGDDEAGQQVASGIYIAVFVDGDGKAHQAKVVVIR